METIAARFGHNRTLPFTVRVAVWSARHRWLVLGLWFACTFGLFAVVSASGGQRVLTAEEGRALIGESVSGQAVFGAAGAGSSSGEERQRFDVVVSNPAGSLGTPLGRSEVSAIASRLAAAKATLRGVDVPVFDTLTEPFVAAAADPASAAFLISPDSSAVLVDATVSGSADEIALKVAAIRPVLDQLRAEHRELRILALNTALMESELIEYAGTSTGMLLLVSLPLTFLILVLAFRALVAAAIPLAMGLGAIVGGMGIAGAYSHLIGPVSPFAVEFVVLIGLAVAIDYSLFVVNRFRTERGAGRDRIAAIEVASATAGRAVFFSGAAVAISMAGLFLLNDPLVGSFAVGSIAAVIVSVAGTMTFLPATLALLDRRVDRGAVPLLIRRGPEGRGLWAAVVRFATRRAVLVTVLTGGLLVAASMPLATLRLGYSGNDLSIMPAELETVRAARAMSEAWPGGSSLTLDVIVTDASAPETKAAMERLEEAVVAVPGVSGPARTTMSADGSVADMAFSLAGGSNDPANQEIVREVRSRIVPAAFSGTRGSQVFVSGDAAYALDYTSYYAARTGPVVGFVLGLSFLLLLVVFRSIAIPLKAILLNLLSFGTAFGVLVLVFHGGSGSIDASNPVMIFAILFGLSMDYHVFILTRVKEARDRGLPSNEAVAAGISVTSGTVTSAAAIMVCVFAGFGTIAIANIQQFGLGMAVAVLVDATLVRSLLLPATMRLLGEWNWWLPERLRWLPRVEVEVQDDAPAAA